LLLIIERVAAHTGELARPSLMDGKDLGGKEGMVSALAIITILIRGRQHDLYAH
jgi:hypothetical protein